MTQYKFKLDGLHCAGCAAKIEAAIDSSNSTENTYLNFTNKSLKFSSNNQNQAEVQSWVQKTVDSIEDGVTVVNENDVTSNDKKEKGPWIKIIISLVFFIAAVTIENIFTLPESIHILLYAASVILCGYNVFISGFKAIFKLRLDENTLMSIAVIAAFCIGEFPEAALVTLLFAIGEALEDRAVDKSRRDIQKLAEIRPDTANINTPNGIKQVSAADVQINQTIVINPFERIPLDGEVISGESNLDTSALTGESLPVFAGVGTKVMSGMMNQEGLLTINVTSTYENSSASRILKMVEDAAATKGTSEKFITKFARIYTPLILLAAVLLTVIPGLITGDFITWLSRSLVFLVASCPCAIVISVPLAFYSGIGGVSKAGVIIKGGKYIEVLAKADAFVFDKTGTLTTGNLAVDSVQTSGSLSTEELIALAAAVEQHSAHPIAVAIKEKAKGLTLPVLSNYQEKAGVGVSALFNGKTVVCGNNKILNNSSGKRGVIYLTLNGVLQGTITVSDTLRAETPSVVAKLKKLGAKTVTMLTGDSNTAAQEISIKTGLTGYHAELMPEDKVTMMKKIKKQSNKVIFVGDGINDAPVIAASDCGIAMGLGSQAAIESADAVLTSGNLKQLPTAVKQSRKVMNTVYVNIIFALGIKALILVLAAIGIAPMWLAVLADTGVSMICVLNSSRLLKLQDKEA